MKFELILTSLLKDRHYSGYVNSLTLKLNEYLRKFLQDNNGHFQCYNPTNYSLNYLTNVLKTNVALFSLWLLDTVRIFKATSILFVNSEYRIVGWEGRNYRLSKPG